MLEELYLENFVLFEKASLSFSPGMNVISGETGSGKSLLSRALAIALGERASAELMRTDKDSAAITAAFRLNSKLTVKNENDEELDIEPDEEGALVFQRNLKRDGRSRLSLNSRPVNATSARLYGSALMDVAAQNEYTRLMDSSYQRELLDSYGRLEKQVAKFSTIYRKASALNSRLQAGEAEKEKVRKRLEALRLNIKDLEEAAYDPEEDAVIEDRIAELSSAGAIRTVAEKGEYILYESEGAVFEQIGELQRETEEFAEFSPHLRSSLQALEEAAAQIDEAARSFREAAGSVQHSPETMDILIERSEYLKKLARRFDCSLHELPEIENKFRQEEESLSGWDTDSEQAKKELKKLLKQVAEAGLKLRKEREKVRKKIEKAVDKEFSGLGMKKAHFHADLIYLWNDGDDPVKILGNGCAEGFEEVVFKISPNPGEPSSTLAETASGGEAARTMLAIKSALAEVHCPPVLFFDEIDAGIGARLGDVIGEKLRELSKSRQIIAITHLPQIAAKADRHIKVSKSVKNGRTVASGTILEGNERVEEVAHMIRGEASTDTTRQQAREMLGTA